MSNVSSATLCLEKELKGEPNLYVVGLAQSDDDTNCDLFTSPLVKCDDQVQATRRVEGSVIPGTHLCVKPISNDSHSRQMDSYSKWLMASSSVLHVTKLVHSRHCHAHHERVRCEW